MQRFRAFITSLIRIAPAAPRQLLIAAGLASVAALIYPIPMIAGWLVVRPAISGTGIELSLLPVGVATAAVLLYMVLRGLSSWIAHHSAATINRALRIALLEHLGQLPLHWFASQSTGGLKKIINNDVAEIEKFIAHKITDSVTAVVQPLIMVAVMVWIDWRLALILVMLMVYAVGIQMGSHRDISRSQFMQQFNSALTMLHIDSVDFIKGMADTRIFNRSTLSFGSMQEAVERLHVMQERVASVYGVRWADFISVIAAPVVLIAVAGALLVWSASLTVDLYLLALLCGSIALVPMIYLLRFSSYAMRFYYSCMAIDQVLAQPAESKGSARSDDVKEAKIVVSGLRKSYGDKRVLQDISFSADPGSVTALVGMSGSGKSTLAAILAGVESADEGEIRLGGVPLGELPAAELAACFSVVFQTPFIFSGTVMDNIRLGREDASQEEVMAAAEQACAAEFIACLADGYATRIGAGSGVKLSGGQAQRIALARMALRNAPVVLLDEATAFADPESEAQIQHALASVLSGKTVIVIAHRLHSIAGADHILVLDQGRIVQRGKHPALIAEDGVYARLWQAGLTARSWTIRTDGGIEE